VAGVIPPRVSRGCYALPCRRQAGKAPALQHLVRQTLPVPNDLRTAVLLSMQRALWEQVTPDLRGVALAWSGELDGETRVEARFLYEGAVGELQDQCVSETEAYFVADFIDNMSTAFVAIAHADRELEPEEEWVFLRWEPTLDLPKQPN
jgi:hypothetical protein